jgi:hypothetical protein
MPAPYQITASVPLATSLQNMQGQGEAAAITAAGGVAADGKGGMYWWDAASTAAQDLVNYTVIQVTGVTTGRWLKRNPVATAVISATTIEVNLGSANFTGKFTITNANISPSSKVLVWQAPGPYTGKGTLADEAELQPVQIVSVTPATGLAVVRWQTPPMVTQVPVIADSRRSIAVVGNDIPLIPTYVPKRIGKVKGNVKFNYLIG